MKNRKVSQIMKDILLYNFFNNTVLQSRFNNLGKIVC